MSEQKINGECFTMDRKKVLIVILTIMSISLIITTTIFIESLLGLGPDSAISIIISKIQIVGLFASILIAVGQLSKSIKISQVTFITDLNKAYVENKDYVELYNALQSCFDGKCGKDTACNERLNCAVNCKLDFDKGHISNYLTFFETIYILYRTKAIPFHLIDDLFAYRFFFAVHSKFFQEMKLKPQARNFKNIFCLEYEWLRWRAKEGKASASAVETIYGQHLLKNSIESALYDELISECKKR